MAIPAAAIIAATKSTNQYLVPNEINCFPLSITGSKYTQQLFKTPDNM
jgi:hypothetical protein